MNLWDIGGSTDIMWGCRTKPRASQTGRHIPLWVLWDSSKLVRPGSLQRQPQPMVLPYMSQYATDGIWGNWWQELEMLQVPFSHIRHVRFIRAGYPNPTPNRFPRWPWESVISIICTLPWLIPSTEPQQPPDFKWNTPSSTIKQHIFLVPGPHPWLIPRQVVPGTGDPSLSTSKL